MRTSILILIFLFCRIPASYTQSSFVVPDSILFVEKTLRKVNKNIDFSIFPGPVTGTTQKIGFVVLPMVVYNLRKADTISPPSSTEVLLYFDLNGGWMTAVKQSLYWNQNKWRGFLTVGGGNLKVKFFGVGRDTSIIGNNASNYVWASQKVLEITAICFRKIFKRLYGGLDYRYSVTNLVGSDPEAQAVLVRSGLPLGRVSETVLIPTFVWDNRDNIFWSVRGFYASLNYQFSNRFLFSSGDYNLVVGFASGYHRMFRESDRMILAWHFFTQSGWGRFPYRTYANYGQGDNVTGYTSGKYVNYSEAAIQAELRYELWKFISCGGYAGTGKIFSTYALFGQSAWLHFGGIRLYFNIIPNRNIRLRLDAALSRKDYGFYIGIGQGF